MTCSQPAGAPLILVHSHLSPPALAGGSEVSHPAVVAPVAGAAPPQRLGLGPADLARLWVLVAVELGRGAAPHAPGGGLVGLWWCGCRRRRRRAVRGGGVPGRRGGRDGGLLLQLVGQWCRVGETVCHCALEALELGLLLWGQAGRGGALLEG